MRSVLKYILLLFLAINIPFFLVAQSTSVTDRTPEQEAVKQTEKMQKELNLTAEQTKNIYQINLKYARERKQSNKRSDAVNRIKSKNEEIGKVLNNRQNFDLQSKRSEIQSVEIDGKRRFTRTDPRTRVNTTQDKVIDSRIQSQDRPERTIRTTRQSQPVATERVRSTNRKTDNPVRQSDNSRDVQRPVRDLPSGTSNRSSSVRSSERRSTSGSSSVSRSSSEASDRESDSRR